MIRRTTPAQPVDINSEHFKKHALWVIQNQVAELALPSDEIVVKIKALSVTDWEHAEAAREWLAKVQ